MKKYILLGVFLPVITHAESSTGRVGGIILGFFEFMQYFSLGIIFLLLLLIFLKISKKISEKMFSKHAKWLIILLIVSLALWLIVYLEIYQARG